MVMGQSDGKSRLNEAGDFIYIKPDVPHEVFNMSDTSGAMIYPELRAVEREPTTRKWNTRLIECLFHFLLSNFYFLLRVDIIPYDRNQHGELP
jgi:hypothetical protein